MDHISGSEALVLLLALLLVILVIRHVAKGIKFTWRKK